VLARTTTICVDVLPSRAPTAVGRRKEIKICMDQYWFVTEQYWPVLTLVTMDRARSGPPPQRCFSPLSSLQRAQGGSHGGA